MADKKSTVALCLPRASHLRRFSSQAAPGKNLGDSPPRVLDSFALDWKATFEPGFAPGMAGLVAHGPDVETFALGKVAFGDGAYMRRGTKAVPTN